MTETEAWSALLSYAQRAGATLDRSIPLDRVRRTLARHYHPRRENDDDRDMMRINSCVDVLVIARSQAELCGQAVAEPVIAEPSEGSKQPWNPDPNDPGIIERQDNTDLNFIRKSVYERSTMFGRPTLWKAWAWDGSAFRKVIGIFATEFAFEALGRALLYYQNNGPDPQPCRAIFLTAGTGRARVFRLVLLRDGRRCDDVSRYNLEFTGEPDSPTFTDAVNAWLKLVESTLRDDRSRW